METLYFTAGFPNLGHYRKLGGQEQQRGGHEQYRGNTGTMRSYFETYTRSSGVDDEEEKKEKKGFKRF